MSLDNSTVTSQAAPQQQHLLTNTLLPQQQPLAQQPNQQPQDLVTVVGPSSQQQQFVLLPSQHFISPIHSQECSGTQGEGATALLLGQQQQQQPQTLIGQPQELVAAGPGGVQTLRGVQLPQPVLLGAPGALPQQPPGMFHPADPGVVGGGQPTAIGLGGQPNAIGLMAAVHPGPGTHPQPQLHHPHQQFPKMMRRQPVVMSPWVTDPGGFSTMLEHVHEGDETEEEAKLETPPNSPTNGKMDMS